MEAKAQETGTTVGAPLGSYEVKRAFFQARSQLRSDKGTAA
ncbi:hypothetical protein ABZW47_32100 [Streptomyces sp. NPDC004549]